MKIHIKVLWMFVGMVFLLLGAVVVISLVTAPHTACQPASLLGLASDGSEVYTAPIGGQMYRWDWEEETWAIYTAETGLIPTHDPVAVNRNGKSILFTNDSDGITIWVGTKPTKICQPSW